MREEIEIRSLIESRAQAVYDKDVAAATADHVPDILLFDVVPPLQYVGLDTARARTEAWFSNYQGRIGYEIRDLDVTVGGDVAFCHYLYHVTGTMKDGEQVNMWVRATSCFCKFDGTWKMTHEHNSVPFDAESGKALLDLKPQPFDQPGLRWISFADGRHART
jgi:ketosteroid isomerase-like protein